MRNQWKRNAVVATVLLFVCAAVYLNWRYAGNIADQAASTGQPEQGEAAGEAVLMGAKREAANLVADAKSRMDAAAAGIVAKIKGGEGD